jgi:hypothetical protein
MCDEISVTDRRDRGLSRFNGAAKMVSFRLEIDMLTSLTLKNIPANPRNRNFGGSA